MRACAVEGCESPVKTRGWCQRHYTRWRRYGNPLSVGTGFRSDLSTAEIVEEIDWLRGGGVSPDLICDMLKVQRESLYRRLLRAGYREHAALFFRHAA